MGVGGTIKMREFNSFLKANIQNHQISHFGAQEDGAAGLRQE